MDAQTVEHAIRQAAEVVPNRDDAQELVAEAGRLAGIEDLALDDSGTAWLAIDDIQMLLRYGDGGRGLEIAARLPAVAAKNPRVMHALLRANMSWDRTQSGTFGLMPPTDEPVLCRLILLAGLDAAGLRLQIDSFVGLAETWHREIATLAAADHEAWPDGMPPLHQRV